MCVDTDTRECVVKTMADRTSIVDKLSVFLAEALGTGLLVFLACLGCMTWGQPYNHLQTVLSVGLVVLIIVQTFGCISGAHINPSITVAATIFRLIDLKVRNGRWTQTFKIENDFFFAFADGMCLCECTIFGSIHGLWSTQTCCTS